jgi:hypothetical protein
LRGGPAAYRRQTLKDLGKRQVLAPQNVAFSRLTFFISQQVSFSSVLDVYQIKTGIDISGHPAAQEVQDGLARRSRFDIVAADRRRGIDDDYRSAATCGLQSSLLG